MLRCAAPQPCNGPAWSTPYDSGESAFVCPTATPIRPAERCRLPTRSATMSARSAQWNTGLPHTAQGGDTAASRPSRRFVLMPRCSSASEAATMASGPLKAGSQAISRPWLAVSERSSATAALRRVRALPIATLVLCHAHRAVHTVSARTHAVNTREVNAWWRPIARTTGSTTGCAAAHALTLDSEATPCGMNAVSYTHLRAHETRHDL